MTKPEGEAKTIVKTSKYKAVKKMSSISPADRLEIRSLIAKYSKIPYRYANEKFSPNELETMNRLFDLIDRTADKGNFVCSENLRNGKLSHGANPSGRWQVINNLLSFRCAVGGPKDWNAFAAIQKRKTTPVGGDPKLSQALSDEVNKFMAVDHPFYTQAKKQEIIQVILSKPTDERTKLLLIRAEYP